MKDQTVIKAKLKSVVKITEKQLQSAPDLNGVITIEGKEYKIAVFLGLNAAMYLSR